MHCLGFSISDSHGVVDLENLERRYHCCPPLYPFGIPFGFVLGKDDGLWEISHNCFFFGALSGGIPYILAWMVILVLAFASVRDLPPGAYETVHWTTFIPHI